MGKWFICHNEQVSGPYSEEEIKARFASQEVPTESLVWGHGLADWRPFSTWSKEAQNTATIHTASAPVSQQLWHFAVEGVSKGPLTRTELIFELKNIHDKGEILVWTKGMKAWADLYEFHDLLDELGLNRREHPRIKAAGTVTVKSALGQFSGEVNSVSPGGFGAHRFPQNIAIGENVKVELTINGIAEPLPAAAAVQYVTDAGYHGFKFVNLNMEARARLMDFVKSGRAESAKAA